MMLILLYMIQLCATPTYMEGVDMGKTSQQRYLETVVRTEKCACGCGQDVQIKRGQTFASHLKRKKNPNKWYVAGHNAVKGSLPPQFERYLHRAGENAPNWKGGRSITTAGYVSLLVDGRRVLEHRHIMEQHLGRKLARNEVVHHRNENKSDNRIENLELLTKAEHSRRHFLVNMRKMLEKHGG